MEERQLGRKQGQKGILKTLHRVIYRMLKAEGNKFGGKQMPCGEKKKLHVDHIKPRSKYPELQLTLSNLQVLCHDCNMGKSAWDETDWREKEG